MIKKKVDKLDERLMGDSKNIIYNTNTFYKYNIIEELFPRMR